MGPIPIGLVCSHEGEAGTQTPTDSGKTQGEDGHLQTSRGGPGQILPSRALEEGKPANTSISDPSAPEL